MEIIIYRHAAAENIVKSDREKDMLRHLSKQGKNAGVQQAIVAANNLKQYFHENLIDPKIYSLYCSEYLRAQETAIPFSELLEKDPIVDSRLNEIHFTDFFEFARYYNKCLKVGYLLEHPKFKTMFEKEQTIIKKIIEEIEVTNIPSIVISHGAKIFSHQMN